MGSPVVCSHENFLIGRVQRVLVDGQSSDPAPVDSGVPQGTVTGPLWFLLYINDLPYQLKSTCRLFADDCLIYAPIRDSEGKSSRHVNATRSYLHFRQN